MRSPLPLPVVPLPLLPVALMLALLCATIAWHFPFMLWDHLDLAPIYAGWQNGTLLQTGFLRIHGGHLHTAAYVVLLATTWLSHGQTWLDCVASWALLVVYAALVLLACKKTLPMDQFGNRVAYALIVVLALYPGHLANLQWGWQVAVFLCLVGTAATIYCLTVARMTWTSDFLALAATGLALMSFATGLALVPIALIAIATRKELSVRERLMFAAPWLLVCLAAVYGASGTAHVLSHFSAESAVAAWGKLRPVTIGEYTLNYLGSGIARFLPGAAPWLAVVALASAIVMIARVQNRRAAAPWISFLAFAVLSAVLTALARYGEGDGQAFASRYVSFSTLFWIGWVGLFSVWSGETTGSRVVRSQIWLWMIAALAAINAIEMTQESARLGAETRVLAQTLCSNYPNVDERILSDMYYGGAQAAREHLQILRERGFAPFDACPQSAAHATH